MSKQVVIGYSGHAYVVLDAAEKTGLQVKAYTEKKEQSQNPYKLEYLGSESDESFEEWGQNHEFILGIGDNKLRGRIANLLISKKETLRTIIHPSANIGAYVDIGQGTFIAAGVSINPMVKIGEAAIINTGAIVEHECSLGYSVHIAPGAVLAGNVKVGDRSFIGANSIVKEGVEIGNDVIVGAGTVILNNIQNGNKIVGNPGRLI